jgi:hypothetical protein
LSRLVSAPSGPCGARRIHECMLSRPDGVIRRVSSPLAAASREPHHDLEGLIVNLVNGGGRSRRPHVARAAREHRHQMLLLRDAQRDHEHPRAARLDTTRFKLRHYPDLPLVVIDALLSLSSRVKAGQGVSTRVRSCPVPFKLTHYPAFPLEPKVTSHLEPKGTSLALRQGGVTGGWSCLALPGQYVCCRTSSGLTEVIFVALNPCSRPPVPGVVLAKYEVVQVGLPAVPPLQEVVGVDPKI